ncbi:DUF5787 family protein [Halococcus salsus]|uniref:DUF5787 family protein n=1 Tax=Halococcus salsus TaxID=2162894 RepID=UPI001358769D|nr:DUF5787 family protein [Halococcus salsus]
MNVDSEFVFELGVCAWAERNWPPEGTLPPGTTAIVARQLGTKYRRWDTVVVEANTRKLAERARFGTKRLDSDLLGVVRNAPAEWAWYRECLPEPDYPWRYVREAVHRAAGRGIVETRRRNNRIELRRKWAYPDWVERVVAIENKPDLTASAARALAGQIERDVALGLCDEVWVATARTDDAVEPVLLRDFPVEAGVLVVDTDGESGTDAEVVWHPRTLAAREPGTRITERATSGNAAEFEYASREWKAEKRLGIAERAYERGWRSYVDTMRPDCRHFELRVENGTTLPWCAAKGYHQSATECAWSCGSFEPEPPAWRSRGWPIEGGPGKAIKRLLADQRERNRPDLD